MKYTFVLIFLFSISCQNNQNIKQVRDSTITIQKFDTPASELEMNLSEEDSLLYHEVVADYGNYWETTSGTKIKRVAFDRYSGTILLYENDKNTPFDKSNPNIVFQWEFNDSNPNLIKGIHGWKENDTIMCWTYDQNKQIMIDEKGLIYKRKLLVKK
jgi:hypothetical protein